MAGPRSILIIANPTAGKGRHGRTADAVAAALRARDRRVTVRNTSASGEARDIAARAIDAACPDIIVACGGDGTVQEVADALAHRRNVPACPALGIAPAGRCNDFARALGIPTDPPAIAAVLADGTPRPIDLGRANGRHFCTVATLGLDAEVSSFVDAMKMPLSGTIAYLYGAFRVLLRYRAPSVRIHGDFGTFDGPIFLASTANTSSYGGGVPIAPGALPTDGELHLCIIRAVSRLRSPALAIRVLRGRHAAASNVRLVTTTHLHIHGLAPRDAHTQPPNNPGTALPAHSAPAQGHDVPQRQHNAPSQSPNAPLPGDNPPLHGCNAPGHSRDTSEQGPNARLPARNGPGEPHAAPHHSRRPPGAACSEALELWADGEPLTRTPVTIDAVPAAVRVMLPG